MIWSRRPGVAGFLLGLLAAMSFPPLHVIPVLFVTVPLLLRLIGAAPSWRGAFKVGFWFGFGQHVIGLYWITEAIMLESARYWWLVPLAVPALSALLALFIALPCTLARAVPPGWQRLMMFGGAWVLFDLARQFVGTGFPWNPWGSVWAIPGPVGDTMIQPAAWVGTPGLTLATVLVAGLPSLGRRGMAAALVTLVGWAAAGTWRLQQRPGPAPGASAILVQGNVTFGSLSDRASATAAFQRQLDLTRRAVLQAGNQPTVVIWSEGAAGWFLLDADASARQAIATASNAGGSSLGAIVGSLRFPLDRDGSPAGPPWNSLVAMAPTGAIDAIYDKWHLVPFGEFAPSWVPFSIQIVPGQFAFGTGPKTLGIDSGRNLLLPRFGALICYETIYPGQVVDEADRPSWLVNITNDAWFGNSTGPRQHLTGARLRAVEEGLPLMRVANTGISAGFDAWGRELGRLPIGVADTLTITLPGARPPTSFSRLGLAIPGLLGLAAVAASLFGRRRTHLEASAVSKIASNVDSRGL